MVVVCAAVARRLPEYLLARALLDAPPAAGLRPAFDRRRLVRFFAQSGTLAAAQVLQLSIMLVGTYLVGRRGSLADVGAFRGLFDLASKVWFLSSGVGLVVFPAFARLLAAPASRRSLATVFPLAARTSAQAYAVVLAAGLALAHPLMPLLGFPDAESRLPFALLLAGSIAVAHGNTAYELLQSAGAYVTVAVLNGVVLLAIVVTASAADPLPLLTAVCLAWAVANTLGAALLDRAAMRVLESPPKPGLGSALAVALVVTSTIATAPGRGAVGLAAAPLAALVLAGAYRDGTAAWRTLTAS